MIILFVICMIAKLLAFCVCIKAGQKTSTTSTNKCMKLNVVETAHFIVA